MKRFAPWILCLVLIAGWAYDHHRSHIQHVYLFDLDHGFDQEADVNWIEGGTVYAYWGSEQDFPSKEDQQSGGIPNETR